MSSEPNPLDVPVPPFPKVRDLGRSAVASLWLDIAVTLVVLAFGVRTALAGNYGSSVALLLTAALYAVAAYFRLREALYLEHSRQRLEALALALRPYLS